MKETQKNSFLFYYVIILYKRNDFSKVNFKFNIKIITLTNDNNFLKKKF